MKLFNLIPFIILFICCSASDSNSSSTQDESIPVQEDVFFVPQTIDGVQVQREVLLHLPENFDSTESYPVVIAFHGNGGSKQLLVFQVITICRCW